MESRHCERRSINGRVGPSWRLMGFFRGPFFRGDRWPSRDKTADKKRPKFPLGPIHHDSLFRHVSSLYASSLSLSCCCFSVIDSVCFLPLFIPPARFRWTLSIFYSIQYKPWPFFFSYDNLLSKFDRFDWLYSGFQQLRSWKVANQSLAVK